MLVGFGVLDPTTAFVRFVLVTFAPLKIRSTQKRTRQIRRSQVRGSQRCALEMRTGEIRRSEVRSIEVLVLQPRTVEVASVPVNRRMRVPAARHAGPSERSFTRST